MTTEFQTDVSANNASTDTINIGKRLKSKRVELGFDEKQVSSELKITTDQVRALEANNFTYFRSVTFARGFLKSYCRLLDIDPTDMVRAFDADREKQVTPSTIQPVDKVNKQSHFGDPIVVFISIVVISVLVFLVFWWPSESSTASVPSFQSDEQAAAEFINQTPLLELSDVNNSGLDLAPSLEESVVPNSENLDIENSVIENVGSEDIDMSSDDEIFSSAQEVAVEVPNVSIPDSANEPSVLESESQTASSVSQANSVAPTISYSDDIEIAFVEDCWTEIRDATGKILFSGVKSKGSQLSLTGQAPYRVILGYTKGVSSLTYKGEAFDFSSFVRNDLARFELK
ncbi:RodZ domain-containing protein [Marinomonas hwangdonensis]|nr:RodZ domain-containing protein [Marinomonas hwangdonensis]